MRQLDPDKEAHRQNDPGNSTRAPLNGRLVDHLLRTSIRRMVEQAPKSIAADLAAPYSSVTAHLRQLVRQGAVCHTYVVNPFRTRFCHEFRIGLRLGTRRIRNEHDARSGEHENRQPGSNGASRSIEWFFSRLLRRIRQRQFDWLTSHLVVTDVVILHGAPGCDVEMTVLTDDGIFTAGRFVREVLLAHPAIKHAVTHTVAWRCSFDGYSGGRPAERDGQGDAPEPSADAASRHGEGESEF